MGKDENTDTTSKLCFPVCSAYYVQVNNNNNNNNNNKLVLNRFICSAYSYCRPADFETRSKIKTELYYVVYSFPHQINYLRLNEMCIHSLVVCWVVTACSGVVGYQRFGGP